MEVKKYDCKSCGLSFDHREKRKRHLLKVHGSINDDDIVHQ